MSDPVRHDQLPADPADEAGRVEQRGHKEQAAEHVHAGEQPGAGEHPGAGEQPNAEEHPHAGEHHGMEHGAPLGPIDWPVWAAAIVGVGAGLAVVIGLYLATSQ